MQLNGSQIFVEVLCEQGVDTIFGYPGGAVLNLYDELYKNSDRIHHVLTAHEQGASHAADGYARATGRTGVVLATSGPGATNLVTGIATAYMDSVPMVAFTGNVATTGLGKDGFQEAYIEGITMPITKHNFTVRRVEELADTMRSAFRIAQSGRKGPVLVDIPKDVTAAVCEFTPKQPEQIRTVTTYDEQQVKWAADIINAAKRPLVYFGGGVRSAASCQPLRDLIHKAEIPATYTLMAAGVVPYGDPMNIGMVGMHGCYTSNRAVADCDVLIALGTRFSDRVALNPKTFAKNATIIQIDIDPSELGKNVDVDLAIAGDVCYVLSGMLPLIEEKKHPDWMKMIHEWQAQDYHPVSDPNRLMPHQVIGEVCSQCGPEAVYVTDVGQHQMWAHQFLPREFPRTFLSSGGLGTMGFGFPAAIGAAVVIMPDLVPYAADRLRSWQDPFADPLGDGHQTIQSLYAIGSGGATGLGLGNSRQKYLYVPEPQNDFIFSIVCEELGFIGAMAVIILFALFVVRGFIIASRAPDKFGSMLAVGLTAQIGIQAIVNIAVVTNTIPNTGISLPFFSYGGTALAVQLAEVGIVLSVSRQMR